MQGADGQQSAGVLVVGTIKKKDPKNSRLLEDDESEWVFYMMPPNEFMPKE